ncbi:hypothetical protein BV898_15850 [Hypsibius exemplaris]|uniref:WAP domain-containing protein n=1 Tax=Hypsibius exemplaris TaxID=2072580 RepID=A0A9X6RKQ9_HYPEX|nr:hypothetical protein BV898_15850 [Hypsibius exemplaris]
MGTLIILFSCLAMLVACAPKIDTSHAQGLPCSRNQDCLWGYQCSDYDPNDNVPAACKMCFHRCTMSGDCRGGACKNGCCL